MNSISVYGRVASDVTTKDFNGRNCASFRFASQTKRKDKNSQDNSYITNFYNVSVWGATADICSKYLKKGYRAAISGELVIRNYVGTDQQTHTSVEIDANAVDLVETKSEAEAKSGSAAPVTHIANSAASAPAQQFTPVEVNTDELPF